jgi:hypothetical protein
MTARVRSTITIVALVASVVAVLAWTVPAEAAGNGAWAVEPATDPESGSSVDRQFFFFEAAPGAVIDDWVAVKNISDESLTFDVFGADAFNLEDGSWAMKEFGEEMLDVGAWVWLNEREVIVEPQTEVRIPIRIEVPSDASPGDYAGGIVARNRAIEGLEEGDGIQIGLQRAVGTRVFVRVSGVVRPAMAITSVTLSQPEWWRGGPVQIEYTLKNVGNMRLAPRVAIGAEGILSETVDLDEHEIPVLLPQQSATRSVEMDDVPLLDLLTVNVVAMNDSLVVPGSSAMLAISPWVALAAAGLAALLGGALVWRRRSQRVPEEPSTPPLVNA